MNRVPVDTAQPYEVLVGRGALSEVAAEVADASATAVVTDGTVGPLYLPRLGSVAGAPSLTLEPGEGAKSLATLERVLRFLAQSDLDRQSVVVALGGGVVGDIAGLAASLYMRGVPVVQCPTSLLAQVDSSVGGKTAVNLPEGKNLVGTFHQPRAVFADVDTLRTLPDEELRAGLGEVVKSALVGDAGLLDLVDERADDIVERDPDALTEVVRRCVAVKGAVVARDEEESGERKKLNLGHTFAHSIERVAGYGTIPHGIAVATGLVLALDASAELGLLQDDGLRARVAGLLDRLGLFASLKALRESYARPLAADELVEGLRHDKKGGAGTPALVLVRAAADVVVDQGAEPALLRRLLR